MAFGAGAYFYVENGLGREVTQEEALRILRGAMEAGLVLQPGNGQKAWNLCMCCGCCCALLKMLKKMEKPAEVAHTNFHARVIPQDCTACSLCEDRCPMDAISVDETAVVNRDRCIGCGVCVGICAPGGHQAAPERPAGAVYSPAGRHGHAAHDCPGKRALNILSECRGGQFS